MIRAWLDKLLHYIVSAILVVVFVFLFGDITLSVLATLLVGIFKEMYDEFSEGGTGADWWDFFWDILGILTGVGWVFVFIK